jgi:hypothetical protein
MKVYDLIIGQLKALGLLAHPQRDGYLALCPAHEDGRPSLSVRQDEKGGVMLKCFKGCGYDDIRAVLKDVKPEDFRSGANKRVEEWVHEPARRGAPRPLFEHPFGGPIRTWGYWVDGALWAFVCRFDTPNGKEVRPYALFRAPETGKLEWRWSCPPGPRPIYGLKYLKQDKDCPVVVVEGEKACVAFCDCMTLCVTWLGGSSAVSKTDWTPLAGREVVLLPDSDEPGRRCMWELAEIIAPISAGVRFAYPPPGVPEGWDIADPMPEGWSVTRILEESNVGRNPAEHVHGNVAEAGKPREGATEKPRGHRAPPAKSHSGAQQVEARSR